jgi:hypothetical protein
MPHKAKKEKKYPVRKALALWIIGVTLGAMALVPQYVSAQATLVDIPRVAENVVKGIKQLGSDALRASVATMLINIITFAADRAAYDAAVLIASGGNAEEPLYDQTPIEAYFKEVGLAVAGKAIDEIDSSLEGAGGVMSNFNLCAPRSPEILLSFKFGIKEAFKRPEPKCDVNKMADNWGSYLSEIKAGAEGGIFRNQTILTQLANVYNPNVNEFGVGLQLYSDILGDAHTEADLAKGKRLQDGPFKDVADFITGNVETPSGIVADDFITKTKASAEVREKLSIQILGSDGLLLGIGKQAGSIFANTLLSELTQRIYTGLFTFNDVPEDPFNPDSFTRGNAEDARNTYSSFLSAAPLEITNFSILSDFGSCPAENRGLYNCVADNSLISAVARAETGAPMTLREAMDEGLIDGNWPLIPSSDHARDQDPYCYTYGFCHSNLVKLRKARIISIGWELAAEAGAKDGKSHTLNEVVNGFDSCSPSGEASGDFPWCKLIDPNWVLKYPDTQCRAQVYGQLLESSASDQRKEECVDMPSCIAEDDDGTCTGGYGYCVREENVWDFRGESCPEEFASCITVESDDKTASYLRNTTDPGPCTADNAGCLWYATEKEQQADGSFEWAAIPNIATADATEGVEDTRIYLTNAAEECDPEEGGCRELIERTDSLRLNIVVNPSFEDDVDNNSQPDGWSFSGSAASWDEGTYERTGDGSVRAAADVISQSGLVFSQSRFYTMSFYARQETDGAGAGAELSLTFTSDDGSAVDLTGTSMTTDCVLSGSNTISVNIIPDSTEYSRTSCTFTSPTQVDSSAIITGKVELTGSAHVDDVQIEQGEDTSDYHEGYTTTSVSTITVKVPPDYLGCTGGNDDSEACADYAKVCTENDVGCSLYTPTNGDPAVTGVAGPLDYCPSACVGYDTYKQEPTRYEPVGDFPVYFIPDTAESCGEEEVGCDEFTNIATEGKSYFTYVRACVTESQADANLSSDNEAVFYTWEGSDKDGYQLKTWNLIESDLGVSAYKHQSSGEADLDPGSAPCVNWTTTSSGVSCADNLDEDGNSFYDWDTADCDEHDDIFTNPDCREFYDADGGIHYREWSKTVTVDNACSTFRKTAIVGDDAGEQEANCEESGGFFDDTGSCLYYGFEELSTTCSEKANGCRSYTGGRSRNSRVAFEDTVESGDLNLWDSESATTITYSNESLATGGHSILATAPFQTFMYDNGSDCAEGDDCSGTANTLGGECTVSTGDRYCGTLHDELFQGKTYTLSFWAKGSGDLDAGFNVEASASKVEMDHSFGQVELATNWQEFKVGPLAMTEEEYEGFGEGSTLVFYPSDTAYIDNITLREGEDNITIIKDSWVTPASCDETPDGAASPQYYLGCQEYLDQDGDSTNLKSFSKLCDEDKVGCEDFFMTEESTSPYAEVHNAICETLNGLPATSATACYFNVTSAGIYDATSPYLCTIGVGESVCDFDLDWLPGELPSHISYSPSTKIVPADKDVFLVVNDDVTCSSAAAGCEELGNVLWTQDHTGTEGAESVYFMNDPDTYEETLCTGNELFCEEWTGSGGVNYYFRDPGDQTCEYRTDVTTGGSTYSGWFKTGTDTRCYGDEYVIGGDFSGIWKNGDEGYSGWAGTCTAQYDGCSEFQDLLDVPEDTYYGEGDGESYFYLSNANLDENSLPSSQKCDGKVSLKNGCALFNDTGDSSKNYQSSATEMASRHADVLFNSVQFDLVDPIDCESGSSVIDGTSIDLCASRCIYSDALVDDITNDGAGGYSYGTSCYEASDCAPIKSESGDMIDASACGAVNPDGETVPRLENDTNVVLKVNRDRECSEWLSCAGTNTVWDERTSSYRTICDDIELCTEYSTLGNSSFCSKWKTEDPEVVLDTDRYTSRDITWYGDDYSGYAIPDMFPVQTLTQANVAPPAGFCNLNAAYAAGDISEASYNSNNGVACSSAFDCVGTALVSKYPDSCPTTNGQEYRLVLNAGSCDEAYGESCTVGSCSETGAACSSNAECGSGGGNCMAGTCYDFGGVCATDADCGSGETCLGSVCAADKGEITVDQYNAGTSPDAACTSAYGSGLTFAKNIDLQSGTCINDSCLLAPNGKQFAAADTEAKMCRAYPEVNSPFDDDLVDEWFDTSTGKKLENSDDLAWDDTPYNTVSGFENAQFCAPGEECACTYKKIAFGEAGETRYTSQEFDMGDDTGKSGICTAGKFLGALCDVASQDTDCGDGGICTLPSREDTLLGMDGYCLERDTGININGDRNEGACITWLPVDQLVGSTDIYGKYTSAGFSREANYCSSMTVFADVSTATGCVEGDAGETIEEDLCINAATTCPPGTYGVVGPRYKSSSDAGTIADSCPAHAGCGYICVPLGATTESGESCDPGDVKNRDIEIGSSQNLNRGDYAFDAFWVDDTQKLQTIYEELKSCTADGRRYATTTAKTNWSDTTAQDNIGPASTFGLYGEDQEADCDSSGGDNCGWDTYTPAYSAYIACSEYAQVQDADRYEGAPWTDRLLNENSGFTELDVSTTHPEFAYTQGTTGDPFGRALNEDEMLSNSRPSVPAQCIDGNIFYAPDGSDGTFTCPSGTSEGEYSADLQNTETRALADFSETKLTFGGLGIAISESFEDVGNLGTGVKELLQQIYGQSLRRLLYSDGVTDGLGNFLATITGEPSIDTSSADVDPAPGDSSTEGDAWDVRDQGNPPTVWSLNSGSCSGTECEEGQENSLTLNEVDSGNQSASDFFRAYVKFYAAADKNQLPLRRVIVDWGDDSEDSGSTGSDNLNFYKNHRGLQDNSTVSKCESSSEWGLTDESCDPNYFSYSHVYTCSSEMQRGSIPSCEPVDENGHLPVSPCVNDANTVNATCSFQPRVHVRDNWGWCTGECAFTDEGCFDGDGSLSEETSADDCRYSTESTSIRDPWVYYNGIITVDP